MEAADIAHHLLVYHFRPGVYGRVAASPEVRRGGRLAASAAQSWPRHLAAREDAQRLLKGRWLLALLMSEAAKTGGLLILFRAGVYVTNLFN